MIRRTFAFVIIAAVKTVISLGLLWTGFRAISDDDFSRVTIAQRFALEPELDPSGTSWLPLPFWVYGGVMKAFGTSLAVAQITAIVLGVYAAVGVYVIARTLELTPRAALLGALVAACIPHSAHYGAAMVPDYPTAVLALAAVATLPQRHGPTRMAGAFAACLATLCRYETWPIALVVVGYAVFDAWHEPAQRRWLVSASAVAPAGAVAWMLHGLARHQDALFFFKRVSAYRRALGVDPLPWAARLVKHPVALFTAEPELMVLACMLPLVVWLTVGRSGLRGQAWSRPTWAVASVIGFLIVGDLLDGSPTHHEERTLLVAWLGLSLYVADLGERLLERAASHTEPLTTKARVALLSGLAMVVGVAALVRLPLAPREPFVDRSSELQIGQLARSVVAQGERLAVYTDDYGYLAVQAAFARPRDAAPLLRRDPRQREADPASDPLELARRLDALEAHFLVLPTARRAALGQWASLEVRSNGFLLAKRN